MTSKAGAGITCLPSCRLRHKASLISSSLAKSLMSNISEGSERPSLDTMRCIIETEVPSTNTRSTFRSSRAALTSKAWAAEVNTALLTAAVLVSSRLADLPATILEPEINRPSSMIARHPYSWATHIAWWDLPVPLGPTRAITSMPCRPGSVAISFPVRTT